MRSFLSIIFCVLTIFSSQLLPDTSFARTPNTQREIAMIKESALDLEKTMPIGKLFESYDYISEPDWSVYETNRGQRFVEFRARYDLNLLVSKFFTLAGQQEPCVVSNDFMRILNDANVRVDLIAQFLLDVGLDGFTLAYIGLEFEGEDVENADPTYADTYMKIVENAPLSGTFPDEFMNLIAHEYIKYFISNHDLTDRLTVGGLFETMIADGIDPAAYPLILYHLNEVEIDEEVKHSFAEIEFALIDKSFMEMNAIEGAEEDYVDALLSNNIEYQTLFSGAFITQFRLIEKEDGFYITILDDEENGYVIALDTLFPPTFAGIFSMDFTCEMPEYIHEFAYEVQEKFQNRDNHKKNLKKVSQEL